MFKASEIERLRKLKRIPQYELVSQIGMTKGGYHNAIKNNDLKASVVDKIAKILDVPVSKFFDEGDNVQNQALGNHGHVLQAKKINQGGGTVGDTSRHKDIEKLEYENRMLHEKIATLEQRLEEKDKYLEEKEKYLEDRLADKDAMLKQKDELIAMYKKQAEE